MTSIRIKATDQLRNVAYIYQRAGQWKCALANGMPAAFSYAGVRNDEMAAIFALEDAATPEQALAVVMKHGSRGWSYELVMPDRIASQVAEHERLHALHGPAKDYNTEAPRTATIHIDAVTMEEMISTTDRREVLNALGYLTMWNLTFPRVEIRGTVSDVVEMIASYYREGETRPGYVIGAVWHDDHFGFHS